MNPEALDQVYTSMAQTLTRVGESRAPLFLSILGLSLLSRLPSAEEALSLLAQAEAASLDDGAVANYPASSCAGVDPARPT